MYSDPNLDAPPPQSQFRRPWSPEVGLPHSSSSLAFQRLQEVHYGRDGQQGDLYSRETSPPRRTARREASEVSVEALDLADYARTLRHRQAEDAYPPFPSQMRPQNIQSPSTFPSVIPGASSTDYLPISTPSLLSRGPTLSSNATMDTFTTIPRPLRRPFSLPHTPITAPASHAFSSRAYLNQGPYTVDGNSREMQAAAVASSEGIDISRFPKWSRGWYNPNSTSQPPGKMALLEPGSDIYTSLPPTQFQSGAQIQNQNMSIFDPKYVHDPHGDLSFNPYIPSSNHHSSAGHTSREVLPWSNDHVDHAGPMLDPMLKEERVRMLEREFGSKANEKGKDHRKGLVDEEGKPLVGTIDAKGHLVTVGPRRRIALRTLQVLLAAAACIPAIYAAIVIKATDPKKPPPPANKPATFVLYALSSITLLTLLYMYLVRPCCFVRSKSPSKHPLGGMPNMGMMVLPVAGGGNGKKTEKPKAGKKHKGKWGPPGAQDVQVNLIVDPAAFQPPEESDSETNEEEEEDAAMPGGYNGLGQYDSRQHKHERRKKRNRRRRRRGVFEGLAMEEQWRVARAWAKKVAAVDVVGLVLWSAAFVFIMMGEKCPSGGFNGWCNAYNVSIASACLLAVSFGIGTFFDVQDLHASKQSPRTRS